MDMESHSFADEPPALIEGSLSSGSAPPSPPTLPIDIERYVLKIEFKYGSRADYASEEDHAVGEYVIVEGDRGIDLGLVVDSSLVYNRKLTGTMVTRTATPDELDRWKSCHASEQDALRFVRNLVEKHRIPITVHGAEYQFDRKKLTFHYSTEADHPEFKSLLRGCYRAFKCRIWMNNCRPKENSPGVFQPSFREDVE